ncbi:hypothetical protein AZI86_18920 [Bdellovibrio bacteriovorus]|uniref:KTSC domain-containing protein n=1 Tax=Bdellovibrio bacteriovorus TaxID=959 RepID=A0A150WD48_BDEBC|nr:hypothetical protein [Bdellovibrio bacteriovorus]KYG60985.1 hypothetical protein AZI86_18920 [Bdellovibrio bacteriovorus]
MKPYKNISGKSGVIAYEIRERSIVVVFVGGDSYLYDYVRTGKREVEKMKELALQGWGLATYISMHVKDRYAQKIAG